MIPQQIIRLQSIIIVALSLIPAMVLAQDYAPDEIIIKFKPGKLSKISSLTFGTSIKTKRTMESFNACTLKLPKGTDLDATIARYKKNPNVEYVGYNHMLKIATTIPNDPVFFSGDDYNFIPQWGLLNEIGVMGADIHATQAWDITKNLPAPAIAVLDTGFDTDHPDLVSKLWINPGEIAYNSVDDDHNGFVDDINGWNFVSHSNYIEDDYWGYHGSAVSGIAAAASNNGIGIAGVSWNSKIVPIKVMNSEGQGLEDDAAAGVDYASKMGFKVINMSLTGLDAPLLRQAVETAWQRGSICVCASGNSGKLLTTYPASYEHALAVGASDETDERAPFSDYGSYLDVVAPGNNIVSTNAVLYDILPDDYSPYWTDSGTSAAAPFVSGEAALIWAVHPTWTNKQVYYHILHTADDIGAPGWDNQTGWGRINVFRAVTESIQSVTSIGEIKSLPLNKEVSLNGVYLSTSSGNIPNRLYAQQANRASGICLYFNTVPLGYTVGDKVDLLGTVGMVSGEVALLDPLITSRTPATATSAPKPLAVTNKALGGGAIGLQDRVINSFYYPQEFSTGLNNIGLLTRVVGKVKKSTYGFFYIDDGAKFEDGSGFTGVRVDCGTLAPPAEGRYAVITGISSCEIPQGSIVLRRVLRPRTQVDIKVL